MCISPVHAGIIPFNTANSSFIFDLLRLSIRLCAVFLAILRPAALVADGCFLLDGPTSPAADAAAAAVAAALTAFRPVLFPLAVGVGVGVGSAAAGFLSSCCCWVRGFIWMIFLDRVGGGGSANEAFSLLAAADDRLRAFTASLGCIGYGAFGDAWDTGDSGVFLLVPRACCCSEPAAAAAAWFASCMAAGGSSKAICRDESCFVPSFPRMSVDEAGVGGSAARGMFVRFASTKEGELRASGVIIRGLRSVISRTLTVLNCHLDTTGRSMMRICETKTTRGACDTIAFAVSCVGRMTVVTRPE